MISDEPSISTVFPGWHVVALLLPLVVGIISLFLILTAPHREGQWFPEQLPSALHALHVAACVGLASATFAFVRHERGGHGPLALLPSAIHIGLTIVAFILNLALALFLIPTWTLK